jgi:CHAT domain-containing protein
VLVERRPAIGATMEPLRRVGQQLYDLVLATALARVSSSRRLVIVGDGLLFYLPFAALTRTGESTFLGEQFEIARAPSAAVLATVRTREPAAPRPTDFVGFGDPLIATQDRTDNAALLRALSQSGFSFAPLPGSRLEVLSAARVFGPEARVFTGPDFTGARAIAELQRPHRVVHFATHAVLDERLPHRSGIVVSEDAAGATLLSARELARLRIPVDLVTLSACQTGLGRIVDGEGVLGLAWALTRAGAGSVMVTLWNISDAASSTMIVAFYRALRDGQTKPAALLAARRALIGGSNPELRHPYYWAGYSLIGG